MKKVLIAKLSSMGDLIHTLPALTDASHAIPDIQFDWMTEPAFAEIPSWHPSVDRVIELPLRQWRKNKWQTLRTGKLKQFKQNLRAKKYDLIIDAQGALKTAIISKLARGPITGFDRNSIREYGAHWLYQQTIPVEKSLHAITRTRQLFAQALNYQLEDLPVCFDIDTSKFPKLSQALPKPFIVLIHSTTWKTKHWIESHWKTLIKYITQAGYSVVLPWGNAQEKDRAHRLAQGAAQAWVPNKLSISECATLLKQASAAVCVDTGLGHLACALQTPAIHLYAPTNPEKIGAFGPNQIRLTTNVKCAPCQLKQCNYPGNREGEAACFNTITPEQVWAKLRTELDL